LHSPIAAVGRRRREGKYTFQKKKKNSKEDSVGNEENGY
jgi:hypothetical protein